MVPWTFSVTWFHDEPIVHIQVDPKVPNNHGSMRYHRWSHNGNSGNSPNWGISMARQVADCVELLASSCWGGGQISECRAWELWSIHCQANEEDSDEEVGNCTLLSEGSHNRFLGLEKNELMLLLYWLNQLGVGSKRPFFIRVDPRKWPFVTQRMASIEFQVELGGCHYPK